MVILLAYYFNLFHKIQTLLSHTIYQPQLSKKKTFHFIFISFLCFLHLSFCVVFHFTVINCLVLGFLYSKFYTIPWQPYFSLRWRLVYEEKLSLIIISSSSLSFCPQVEIYSTMLIRKTSNMKYEVWSINYEVWNNETELK